MAKPHTSQLYLKRQAFSFRPQVWSDSKWQGLRRLAKQVKRTTERRQAHDLRFADDSRIHRHLPN